MKSKCSPYCRYTSLEYSECSVNELSNPMLKPKKPRLLLHACCGPCATACVERLAYDYSLTVFYYNPNIMDGEEYYLRRKSLIKFIHAFNEENKDATFVDYLDGRYEPDVFVKRAQALRDEPEGGRRCSVCFEMRLTETGRVARQMDMDLFATTLTISPHKDYNTISAIGNELSESIGVKYLDMDFKKKDGFKRSIELSKKYGLYRQKFCGCEYARGPRDIAEDK